MNCVLNTFKDIFLRNFAKRSLQHRANSSLQEKQTKTVCHEGINSPCCFLQDSERRRGGKEQGRVSPGNKLEIMDLLDTRVDNLSKEGRALTVTNNWQLFNSQTYYPAAFIWQHQTRAARARNSHQTILSKMVLKC